MKLTASVPIFSIAVWLALSIGLPLGASAQVASTTAEEQPSYGYPITDRFIATVIGTPDQVSAKLPGAIPLQQHQLQVFPERRTSDAVWYNRELRYSTAFQEESAPLIFIIAGTGGAHNGSKNVNIAKAFYQAGFHVVSLSSPTYPNFIVAASRTAVVGHAEKDAEDLYRIIDLIWQRHAVNVTATSFHLTGYSLGGFNAAFISKLDDTQGKFNFQRVLMINPPLSLYNSMSLLDRMVENVPGGVDNVNQLIDRLMTGFTEAYKRTDDVMSDEFLYKAYTTLEIRNEELAALVGAAFRLVSSSLVFTADVMTEFGYIKPSGLPLNRYSDLSVYQAVANRLGFTDYFHRFYYPFYREEYPDKTRDELVAATSLESIEDYLVTTPKVFLMHNADDVILEPGEIETFKALFGARATIYPVGGHCGNLNYVENVAQMVATFTAVVGP